MRRWRQWLLLHVRTVNCQWLLLHVRTVNHQLLMTFARENCQKCFTHFHQKNDSKDKEPSFPSSIHLIIHLLDHWIYHTFIDSLIYSFIRSFIHAFIHSSINSFIHSFINLSVVRRIFMAKIVTFEKTLRKNWKMSDVLILQQSIFKTQKSRWRQR